MKIRVAFSRTIQVRSYEPERVEIEVEQEISDGREEGDHEIFLEDAVTYLTTSLLVVGDKIVADRISSHLPGTPEDSVNTPTEPDGYV